MRMLKRIVQSTPIPISGVMLSFSALDTLFQSLEHPVASYGPVKYICGSIAFLIFLVRNFSSVRRRFEAPLTKEIRRRSCLHIP